MIQFDEYVSNGLKPPTSIVLHESRKMLPADTPVIPDIVAACVFLLLSSDTAKVFLMVVGEILNLGRAQWIFV